MAELVAGPELDQLVHTKVVKGEGPAPAYSTDIAVAWPLFKGLPKPKRIQVDQDQMHHCMCGGTTQGADGRIEPLIWEKGNPPNWKKGNKMAFVICLAALKYAELKQG